jgi:hypothetical protein
MTMRGRGSLEVKPSNNPFFVRTSGDFGVTPEEHVEWKAALNPDFAASLKMKKSENFSFLYTRESDNIGAKVDNPLDSKPRVLTKTEFLKKWRAERTKDLDPSSSAGGGDEKTKPNVERILSVWKQGTKDEDPRFQTTNNTYGFKAPTEATYVAERAGRPQGFSNSFQGIKPQNSGLNVGITKSNVHPSLDPQFA